MDKKKMVDSIIKNSASTGQPWTAEDRDFLLGLEDNQIQNIHEGVLAIKNKVSETNEGQEIGNDQGDGEDESLNDTGTDDKVGSKTTGGKAKIKETTGLSKNAFPFKKKAKKDGADADGEDGEDEETTENSSQDEVEAYIAKAPPALRAIFNEAIEQSNQVRNSLIAKIAKCENNEFTEEELNAFPLKTLKSLAKLASASVSNETPSRNRRPLFDGQGLTENAGSQRGEVLDLPSMDFSSKN